LEAKSLGPHAIDRNTDVRDLMDWVKWKDIRSAVAYLEANQRLANTLSEIDQDMQLTVSMLKPERLLSESQSVPIVAAPSSDRTLILNVRIEKNNGAVPDRAVQLIRQDIEQGVLARLKLVKKDGAEYHFMSPVDLDSAEFADWAEDLIHEIVETVDEAACWCDPELWRKADHQEYGREWMGPSIGWAPGEG
jgi:hypothetical protein